MGVYLYHPDCQLPSKCLKTPEKTHKTGMISVPRISGGEKMANLTRQERETVIIYNEADDTATVSTGSAVTKRKMAKIVQKDQNIRCVYNDGITATYELPKKQVCIRIAAKNE